MDPNVCWRDICALIAQGVSTPEDRIELEHLLFDLAEWIGTGGFLPRPFEAKENA